MGRFRAVLAEVLQSGEVAAHRSFADPKRRLLLGDYLSLFLLGLFNPIARTMRGLVQASRLPKVQRTLGVPAVSLGSFSEAQQLVELPLLERLFAQVAAELPPAQSLPPHQRAQRWLARDSSLFAALPRMAWALSGGGRSGCANHGSPVHQPPLVPSASSAVRLHVSFDLATAAPATLQVTPGRRGDRAARRADLQPGAGYVADRDFSEHYALFGELTQKGCRYLIRLLDRGVEPSVEEELPVSAEDAAHGVQRQAWVRLGRARTQSERLRLIWLRGGNGQLLHLVTNLEPGELSAADAALLYKERWQVEYFFRWVKCLLGCGHWLAESPQGVAIQLYLALIGAVLLQLDLGRRPSKRGWELFQWYLCDRVDESTLGQMLKQQLAAEERRRAAARKKRG